MAATAEKSVLSSLSRPTNKSLLARHRQLAPAGSVRISPLCLGTMNFGDAMKGHMGEMTKETAFEIMDAFVAAGGNFLDTANIYQSEQSEKWLGEWMASRKNRASMVISTKYGSAAKLYDTKTYGCQSNWGGGGTKSMRLSLDESLKNLQTDYVDIFYLHWWDYATSIPELMHGLNDLVVAGKVNYLGISDTPAWVVSKANQYARDHGLRQFVAYQGQYNAAFRDLERDIIPMCRDEGMALLIWGALGQGRFQTAVSYSEREKNNPGRKGMLVPSDKEKAISAILETVAGRYNTSLYNVALAYVMAKAPYLFPIIGGRRVEHLKENLEALRLRLADEDIFEIDAESDFDPGFPHTFLSGTALQDGKKPKGAYLPQDVWMTQFANGFDWVREAQPIRPAADV